MNLLKELNSLLGLLGIPIETGVFSNPPPDEYIVVTPIIDQLGLFADNRPQSEMSEARISLFTKSNYMKRRKEIAKVLLANEITITSQQYVGFETDTKYYHYAIDVMKEYEVEDE